MKKLNVEAFARSGFDMYFKTSARESEYTIGRLGRSHERLGFEYLVPSQNEAAENVSTYYPQCKPRVKHPVALDYWGWVPDGLVWRCRIYTLDPRQTMLFQRVTQTVYSSDLRRYANHGRHIVEWAECLGLQEGYEYDGMEVVA